MLDPTPCSCYEESAHLVLSGMIQRGTVMGQYVEDDWIEYHRALEGIGLSEVESRVARLVSLCRTNARIAAELCIPLPTAKWHVRSVFLKLGVPDRYALAEEVQRRLAALRRRDLPRGPRGSASPSS